MAMQPLDIIVVDDDEEDRFIMQAAFAEAHCDHRVTMFDSSISFIGELNQIRTQRPLPSLIVLDYAMPGLNGVEVLKHLKQDAVLNTVRVIMNSTGMSRLLRQECLDTGAFDCLEKEATYEGVVLFTKKVCEHIALH